MRAGPVLIAAILVAAGAATAQDAGGTQARLTLSPGLFWDDTDGARARLGFGAGFDSVTRSSALRLGLTGAFDSGTKTDRDALRDPRLTLSYGTESRDMALDLRAGFRRARIDALVADPAADPAVDSDFPTTITGTGTRSDATSALRLDFGRTAPFGGNVDLGYAQRRYDGTTDPALRNEDTRSAGLGLRFVINPGVTARLGVQGSLRDVAGAAPDQRRLALNAGADLALTKTLTAGLTLGQSRITEDSTTTSGTTATLALTETRPDGALSGQISTDVTTGGRLTQANATRSYDLPGGGTLALGAGLGRVGDGDIQTLAQISWRNETPTARYAAGLQRALAVNADGQQALRSSIDLSWQQDLDRRSQFGAGLTLRDTDRLDGGDDTRQTDLSVSFRRDLTADWGLRSTYTHRWQSQTGTPDDTTQSVFLGVERGFAWRP